MNSSAIQRLGNASGSNPQVCNAEFFKDALRVCSDCSTLANPQLEFYRQPLLLPKDLMRPMSITKSNWLLRVRNVWQLAPIEVFSFNICCPTDFLLHPTTFKRSLMTLQTIINWMTYR